MKSKHLIQFCGWLLYVWSKRGKFDWKPRSA